MKAAWIRNFWTKTVAFLLAAALVPERAAREKNVSPARATWTV